MRRAPVMTAAVAMLLLVAAIVGVPAVAQPGAGDDPAASTISIVADDETLSGAEVSVRLSEATPLDGVERVLIARDDTFADALSSGLLQRESPLLLVPGDGPVPARVTAEIRRLGATQVLVLGGPQAVSDAVTGQLASAGLEVRRISGADRIRTAVAVAAEGAPDARIAILARAFGSAGAPRSQAFADALSAGGLAAAKGWPILLTETETLADATREHLAASPIERVLIVGGTAAISPQVAGELERLGLEVERVAGSSRAGTAVAVATRRGTEEPTNPAANPARVVLVDGDSATGWQGGFAAAAHSARFAAPIVLSGRVQVPPETHAFLDGSQGTTALTCVAHQLACADGRRALGIRIAPIVSFDPPSWSRIEPGQDLQVRFHGVDGIPDLAVTADGSCLAEPVSTAADDDGEVLVSASSMLDGAECTLRVGYQPAAGEERRVETVYRVTGEPLRAEGDISLRSTVQSVGTEVPDSPILIREQRRCTAEGTGSTEDLLALQARHLPPGATTETTFSIGTEPTFAPSGAVCTFQIDPPPETLRTYWGIYARGDTSLQRPYGLGSGTFAGIELAGLGAEAADLEVRWVVELDTPSPSVPHPEQDRSGRIVVGSDAVDVSCGGVPLPPGVARIGAGELCEARTIDADRLAWVLRPGERNIVSRHASFAIPLLATGAVVVPIERGDERDAAAGTCEDPRPLPLGQIRAGQHPDGAVDVWQVDVPGDAAVRVRANSAVFSAALRSIGVRARTPQGAVVAQVDPTATRDGTILVLPAGSGTVCVEVFSPDPAAGAYWISADRTPVLVRSGEVVDPSEPARHQVSVPADRRLVVEVFATDDDLDPSLRVIDPAGRLVALNARGRVGRDARVELDVVTATTLTIEVHAERAVGDDADGGSYLLSAALVPRPPAHGAG